MNYGTFPGFTLPRGLAGGATYPEIKVRELPLTALTLADGDVDTLFLTLSGSSTTITIPRGLLTPGKAVHVQQLGAGQVTIAGATGVTIRVAGAAKTRAQYSVISIMKIGADLWSCFGDIASS